MSVWETKIGFQSLATIDYAKYTQAIMEERCSFMVKVASTAVEMVRLDSGWRLRLDSGSNWCYMCDAVD